MNQVVEFEPVLDVLPNEFELRVAKPDSRGRGRLYLYLDNRILDIGRTFYLMEGKAKLDNLSGDFVLAKGEKAVFRCIFSGQHRDVEVAAA